MKSVKIALRRFSYSFMAITGLSVFLVACNKSDDQSIDLPAAGLMAFNLVPDKPAIGVALSGNPINPSGLGYTAFTGQYINIYPGNRSVEAYDFMSLNGFTNTTSNFETNKYYSLFVVGADSVYRNVVVNDNFDSLSASNGKAYVRFVNAIPDSSQPVVRINAGGNDVVSKQASFATVSAFTEVNPGSIEVSVNNNGNINSTRKIDVADKNAYTILFTGIPGNSNPDKTVQIKFIRNGTLTDSTTKQ